MSNRRDHSLPLFYRKPQPLNSAVHADVRLIDGDFGFAADTNAVPIAIIEFAQAMRFYPIVFAEGGNFPAAVKVIAQWFPKSERALATALFNSGANVGAVGAPFFIA